MRATKLTGVAGISVTLVVLAVAGLSLMNVAIIPVFLLGGIGMPALEVPAPGRASFRRAVQDRRASSAETRGKRKSLFPLLGRAGLLPQQERIARDFVLIGAVQFG